MSARHYRPEPCTVAEIRFNELDPTRGLDESEQVLDYSVGLNFAGGSESVSLMDEGEGVKPGRREGLLHGLVMEGHRHGKSGRIRKVRFDYIGAYIGVRRGGSEGGVKFA